MAKSTQAVRIAVLASGSGSNLHALLEADLSPGQISLVISNVPGAGALSKGEVAGVPTRLIDHREFPDRERFDQAMLDALNAARIDWIVLAGFMRILSKTFVDAFEGRIVNIHPALLPCFPGIKAQQQAIDAGVRISGCTIHLVDSGVDTGPILAQAAVPVRASDDAESLARRILREEHRLYPRVVKALAEDRLVRDSKSGRLKLDLPDPGALAALRVPAFDEGSA